ncbi:MAG TPA: anti-sigma factor [Pedococcus sp.]|jgi:anti-sigma-K factor RskA
MNADIHGLSGAYAVDALDDVERAAFEQHLAQCAECQQEVAGLRAAATELSHTVATSPPARLRSSVLAQVRTVRPLPPETGETTSDPTRPTLHPTAATPRLAPPGPADVPSTDVPPAAGPTPPPGDADVVPLESRRRRSPMRWLVAAAAAAVLAIGGLVWSPWDSGESPLSPTEQVLQARDAQRYEKVVDGARATIVRSPSLGKAVIIADNMPAAPDGKDFQIWYQNPDGEMVSAGVMPHEAKPSVSLLLDGDASKFTGAGITVEPAGGSTAPTSEPIVLFEFS